MGTHSHQTQSSQYFLQLLLICILSTLRIVQTFNTGVAHTSRVVAKCTRAVANSLVTRVYRHFDRTHMFVFR